MCIVSIWNFNVWDLLDSKFEMSLISFCSKYSMNGSSNQEMCAMDMFGIDSLENT